MTINKLYISDKQYNWKNHPSILLGAYNVEKIIKENTSMDYHTSIEDLGVHNIHSVIEAAQEIYLIDIDVSKVPNNQMYRFGRLYYELFKYADKVKPDDLLDNKVFRLSYYDTTIASREDDLPVLWTAGDSVTFGCGVNHSERWGSLLATKLNLPEVSLSQGGSSITWAADQLLRSDIQSNDTVVWGITNVARFEYAKNWDMRSIPAVHYDTVPKDLQYWNLNYFDSNTLLLISIRAILQVINFCKAARARLVIANLIDHAWVPIILREYENFIDLTDNLVIEQNIKFLDLGTDNLHPGPKQHQHYADRIFNLIKGK